MYIFLVDSKRNIPVIKQPGLKIIWVEDLFLPQYDEMKTYYNIIELNTSVKPLLALYLINSFEYEYLYYYDPDTFVFSLPSSPALFPGSACICLTPHTLSPYQDFYRPSELDILKFGVYNLGFIGLKRSHECIKFLEWWSSRLVNSCFYEPSLGMAVDQNWLNLATSFFDNIYICKNPGMNVAFWNLHERHITYDQMMNPLANGSPLHFFHFSSYNSLDLSVIAKKQSRFAAGSRHDLDIIYHVYNQELALASQLVHNINDEYGFNKQCASSYQEGISGLVSFHKLQRSKLQAEKMISAVDRIHTDEHKIETPASTLNSRLFPVFLGKSYHIKIILSCLRICFLLLYFVLGNKRYLRILRGVNFLFTPYVNAAILANTFYD